MIDCAADLVDVVDVCRKRNEHLVDALSRKISVCEKGCVGGGLALTEDDRLADECGTRSEDPATIRAAVMEGAVGVGGEISLTEVGDRAEAILHAVDALEPGDALLIAGKGHESGQIVGEDILPFDDAEQASVAVAALEGRLT